MSMAKEDKNASVFEGTRLLPMIQKPRIPIPRSVNTAWKVMEKTFISLSFYLLQNIQASRNSLDINQGS